MNIRRVFRLGAGPQRIEREVDDELAYHLEQKTRDLVARGMSRDDAEREAHRQFGDMRQVRESLITIDSEHERVRQRINFVEELGQDLRYAMRMLRRTPAFTATVVLTLAVGIGANTSIFTLVDAVVLRQLPVRNPEELVALGNTARVGGLSMGSYNTALYSYPLYKDVRDRNQIVSGLIASGRTPRLDVQLVSGEEPHRARGRLVSANYFKVLGVGAQAGRVFDGSEDDAIGAAPVVVISDGYWTRRFERSPNAIGQHITINKSPFTIIGVAAQGFPGEIVGATNDLWIPLTMQHALQPNQQMLDDRGSSFLLLLGRLKPGVTFEQAESGFTTLVRDILVENANANNPAGIYRTVNVPVSRGAKGFSRVREDYTVPLYTLMAGVALLLLIICANVSNLLLARAVARGREMGIRLAIGAGRARIVRQLFTECAVLALLSAAGGLLLSWWGSRLLLALAASGSAVIPLDLAMNVPVLAFTAGISILAVGIFGLVPSLRASRVNLAATMSAQGRSVVQSGMRHGRKVGGGQLLIVGQVAVSLVLLVGAGLLVRSLVSVQNAETGLDRDHMVIVSLDMRDRGYVAQRRDALTADLVSRFSRIASVRDVTYSVDGLFSGIDNNNQITVAGYDGKTLADSVANYDVVAPGYVRSIGSRVIEGREFSSADVKGALPVAMVNETMAKHYFGSADPIGRTIRMDSTTYTVVGVMTDIPYHELTVHNRRFYIPWAQQAGPEDEPSFLIRTTGDPTDVVNEVRKAIRASDPVLTTEWVDPLPTLMRNSISQERLVARLATGFGVLALLLAAIGLYGVLTYAVNRRTNEIGLRVALGAQQSDVLRMVVGDALRLVVVGLAIGAPLAIAATRLLRSQLHGVEPTDPIAITAALVVLALAALLAALLPARRASRLDPLVALRAD